MHVFRDTVAKGNEQRMLYLPVVVPKALYQQYKDMPPGCLNVEAPVKDQGKDNLCENIVDTDADDKLLTIAILIKNQIRQLLYMNCPACQAIEFLFVGLNDHDCNVTPSDAVQRYFYEAFTDIQSQENLEDFEVVREKVLEILEEELNEAILRIQNERGLFSTP